MNNMMHRAISFMETDPHRAFTLTELRRAAGIAIKSQYRLSTMLLDSGMVIRDGGAYRFQPYLLAEREQVPQ
jgi:DNA-binding IclR family transcriptional regulator